MYCPFCEAKDTKVVDSRLVADGSQVRRRRECLDCSERFTSYETAELLMPKVVKTTGAREPFNIDKLRRGFGKALEKRPVAEDQIEAQLNHISHRLQATGEREVQSMFIGELVMDGLRVLDHVAYVRFASVYRDFKDLKEFREELDRLEQSDE